MKKAEHRRIDAFELWCWRRLLRVPWTARRSNQSILKIRLSFYWAGFLSLICRSSLHILDTNTLMVVYITNFWQFLSYFFTLSMVYYRSDYVVGFINIFLISLCFYITCKKSRPDITKILFSHVSSLYFIILHFKFRLLVHLEFTLYI